MPVTRVARVTGGRFACLLIVIAGEHRQSPSGVVMMPAFGAAYSDTEIAAVANYVTARFGATPSHLTASDVSRLRAATSR